MILHVRHKCGPAGGRCGQVDDEACKHRSSRRGAACGDDGHERELDPDRSGGQATAAAAVCHGGHGRDLNIPAQLHVVEIADEGELERLILGRRPQGRVRVLKLRRRFHHHGFEAVLDVARRARGVVSRVRGLAVAERAARARAGEGVGVARGAVKRSGELGVRGLGARHALGGASPGHFRTGSALGEEV